MEITNNFKKMVASLGSTKGRREENCFVVEGTKCVMDTIHHFTCRYLLATSQWIEKYANDIIQVTPIEVKRADMSRMSQLTTPTDVIAVYDIPNYILDSSRFNVDLTIVLDKVQDPGNLGTIIRIADWFGINTIICSNDTVDVYNPKVVQATMGAISRVRVHYCDLVELINANKDIPVYGTFLDGDNMYNMDLSSRGFLVMGNEGQGISEEIGKLVTRRLFIPSYPTDVPTSESLNVSMATAIAVAEFRRRLMK